MTRVSPDGYDKIVWVCNDSSNSTLINNTGFFGNAGDLDTKNLNPVLGGQGFFSDGLYLPGSTVNRDYFSGAVTFQPSNISVSLWVYCRSYTGATSNAAFVGKLYRDNTFWISPFYSIYLGLSGTAGNWQSGIAVNTILRTTTISAAQHPFPLNTWAHVGMTYDGVTLLTYINGIQIGSSTLNLPIDYGSSGVWFLGAIPPTAANTDEGAFTINDVRIADIVRPLSYFQNIYSAGVNT